MKCPLFFLLLLSFPSGNLCSQVIDSTFGDSFYFGHPLPGATAIDFDGRDDRSYAMLFLEDSRIILAGHTAWNGESDFAFARLMPDGTFDQTAGPDGKVRLDLGYPNDSCLAAALHSSDRLLMGGCVTLPGQQGLSLLLIRTDPDGNLDPLFGDQGQLTIDLPGYREMITKILALPDGNILIAGNIYYGESYQYPDSTKIFVGRLLPDGQIDSTFGSNGFLYQRFSGCPSTILGDIVAYPDGSLLLTGGGYSPYPFMYIDNFSCNPAITLCRYLPDGEPDTGFGANGTVQLPVTEGWGDALALYGDGRILVAGLTSDFLIDPVYTLVARLLPDGSRDSTFGEEGYFRKYVNVFLGDGTKPVCFSLLDDEIIVGFIDSPLGPHLTFGGFCLRDNGQMNTDFGENGIFSYQNSYTWTNYAINKMAISPDKQKLYFGGWYTKLFHKNMMVSRLDIGGKFPVNTRKEKSISGSMEIYPNPVSGDKIYLAFSNIPYFEQAHFRVYDGYGRIVLNKRTYQQGLQSGIILPELPNGIYVVEFLSEHGRYSTKIILQK